MTEISPTDVQKIEDSEHADLVAFDAHRVFLGLFNRFPRDVDFGDRRLREAFNLSVDRDKLIRAGFGGHADHLPAMTPPWCAGFPAGQEPRPYDPSRARELLHEVGWVHGRPLRLATPDLFEPIARLIAHDIQMAVGIKVEVIVVPAADMLAGARMLIEKRAVPPWDVLLDAWFELSSEAPPAAVHRELVGSDGAFRVGPEIGEFDRLFDEMVAQIDGARLVEVAERIDAYCYEECHALFLCAPRSLTAVAEHVDFTAYRTTFEPAGTSETGTGRFAGERRTTGSDRPLRRRRLETTMPLDWEDVKRRYGDGAMVPTVAGGKTLEVTGADDQAVYIKTSLWKDALAREHLEKAVAMLDEGRLTRHPGHFAEEYRTNVADVRGTSAAHILKDLGHLD